MFKMFENKCNIGRCVGWGVLLGNVFARKCCRRTPFDRLREQNRLKVLPESVSWSVTVAFLSYNAAVVCF